MKILTNFIEGQEPHHNFVPAFLSVIGQCSLFFYSSVLLSLDAGKIRVNIHVIAGFRYDISGPEAGPCEHFHGKKSPLRSL